MPNNLRIGLFCFSGTGNTYKIAEMYKSAFENNNAECNIIRLPIETNAPEIFDYDIIGIGFPVYAFNVPKLVIDFVKSLKKSNKRAFIFCTSGEPLELNSAAAVSVARKLKRRGYTVTGAYRYCMPYNIIFRHSDGMAYKMLKTAEALVPLDCAEILGGKIKKVRASLFARIISFFLKIQRPGAKLNGKFYKIKGECSRCGLCYKNCPQHNITLKDLPTFGGNCIMCMRCSFNCPKNCIKIGLIDGWRVNGAYSFEESYDFESKHKNFCKKSYEKYFAQAEARIEKISENKNNADL